MARFGELDKKEFENFVASFKKTSAKLNSDMFLEKCCKQLAARLLALVIPETPTGIYPKGSGKTGGTLKRGWNATKKGLQVQKVGSDYVVEVTNEVEYASYVEYGHRTRGGKGYVKGKFFLTVSEEKLKTIAPKLLDSELQKELRKIVEGYK